MTISSAEGQCWQPYSALVTLSELIISDQTSNVDCVGMIIELNKSHMNTLTNSGQKDL